MKDMPPPLTIAAWLRDVEQRLEKAGESPEGFVAFMASAVMTDTGRLLALVQKVVGPHRFAFDLSQPVSVLDVGGRPREEP